MRSRPAANEALVEQVTAENGEPVKCSVVLVSLQRPEFPLAAAANADGQREVVCPRAGFRPQSVGVLTGATNLALLPTSTEREHRQAEPKQAAGRGLWNSDGGGVTD